MSEVWAVVFSNYSPAEIDSLWTTEEEASKRRDELNEKSSGMWQVAPMSLRETWEPESTAGSNPKESA